MTDTITGIIGSVTAVVAGDQLATDAPAGATELAVFDVADFDEAGGHLAIDGTVYAYLAIDDDTSTITLAAPLPVDLAAEEVVEVRLAAGDGSFNRVVEYDVELSPIDGSTPITATLHHALIPLVSADTRGLDGETVEAVRGPNEDAYEVTRVFGREAVLNDETVGMPQLQPDVVTEIVSAQDAADQALADAAAAQAAANAAATNAGAAAALAADAKTIAEAAETPAGAQAKADAAEAAAEAAAAADASAKASAAQATAVSAAAADATTKANNAKSAAEAAAAVTAQAKADAAQAAAIAAASDDADDKAEAARLAAVAAAAIDAQNKADAAQAAAEADAAAAQSTANAAQSAANAAQATANAAQSNAAVAQALLDSWKYSGTVKINGGQIQADTVLAGQVAADAITSKHTITGAKVQTTATPARGLKMTDTGLVGYDASGNPTLTYNASTGNVALKGTVSAGLSITGALFQTSETPNSGLKISTAGITGFDGSGNATLAYNAVSGALTLKGAIQAGSEITGATITGSSFATNAAGQRIEILTGATGGEIKFFTSDGDAPSVGRVRVDGNTLAGRSLILESPLTSSVSIAQRPTFTLSAGTTATATLKAGRTVTLNASDLTGLINLDASTVQVTQSLWLSSGEGKALAGPGFDTGWQSGALGSGWIGSASYRIIGGVVYLRGSVSRSSGTGTTMATLPEAARPATSLNSVGRVGAAAMVAAVSTAGAVVISTAYSTGTFYLESIPPFPLG